MKRVPSPERCRPARPVCLKPLQAARSFWTRLEKFHWICRSRLLRFLESKEIRRVGSVDTKIVDVRIVAATNRDLAEMVQEGTFREDLYYRLNVVQIDVPPLRKRVDDIMPLASLFLNRYNKKYHQEKKLTYDLIKALEHYPWPGNVRQLRKNLMENMVVIASNNEYLQPEDLAME